MFGLELTKTKCYKYLIFSPPDKSYFPIEKHRVILDQLMVKKPLLMIYEKVIFTGNGLHLGLENSHELGTNWH